MRHPASAVPFAALAALLAFAVQPARAQDAHEASQDLTDHLELKQGGAVVFQKAAEAPAAGAPAVQKKKKKYKGYHKDPKRKEALAKYQEKAQEILDIKAVMVLTPPDAAKAKQLAVDKKINEDVQDTLAEKIAKTDDAIEKAQREAQLVAAKDAEKGIAKHMADIEKAAGKKVFKEGAAQKAEDGAQR